VREQVFLSQSKNNDESSRVPTNECHSADEKELPLSRDCTTRDQGVEVSLGLEIGSAPVGVDGVAYISKRKMSNDQGRTKSEKSGFLISQTLLWVHSLWTTH
jgi:hypothetical protein